MLRAQTDTYIHHIKHAMMKLSHFFACLFIFVDIGEERKKWTTPMDVVVAVDYTRFTVLDVSLKRYAVNSL